MTILQAIVLGITQGITEFAPVSSSGHLILVPWLFGWSIVQDPALNKTFDVALHIGTLLGAVIYFRTDLGRYVKAWIASIRARSIRSADERLAWALVVGTIPGAIAGALFESAIEDTLGQPWLIAVMLAVFGVILYVVDRICRSDRGCDSIGPRTGLFLGHRPGARAAARGVSLRRDDDRRAADRARTGVRGPLLVPAGDPDHRGRRPLQGGRRVAARVPGIRRRSSSGGSSHPPISGFVVIWFLLRYLRRHDFLIFMVYRLAVAALVFR